MPRILSSTYQAMKGCKILLLLLLLTFAITPTTAQVKISIGGNVYGGGNQGEVGTEQSEYTFDKENATDDRTSVIIRSGEIKNVFGGGRMAGVYGNSTVTIDGTTSTNQIIIGNVYGGNDIAGEVKGGAKVKTTYDASFSAKSIYIAKLFGGGNGDYTYGTEPVDGVYQVKTGDEVIATSTTAFTEPDIAKVAIDLKSGAFGQVFGGGNKATVNTQTDITLNNQTDLDSFTALSGDEKTVLETYGWLDEWFTDNKPAYQFNRVFGGNNKVNMAIRPTWHLTKGTIDNLYSGGNAGGMTYPNGILLAITGDDMIITNVYGGCRMADVNPGNGNGSSLLTTEDVDANGLQEGPTVATFEASYAARVLITGGRITNVYGGNDISGKVFLGTQVEIHNSIIGDVYGGGNGSYAYTDNATLKDDSFWGDFFYNPGSLSSAAALSQHRPNVESTLIHVKGKSESNPTYIGGALYCGGNSATLRKIGGELSDASANLKIGSYVVAHSIFLGSNGEKMINGEVHEKVGDSWRDTDILAKYKESSPDFSQMDLTTTADFEEYMRGVEVAIIPTVTFDAGYEVQSTKVGSLYLGGNIGSMSAERTFNMGFLNNLVIFEKVVGGCNNANVAQSNYNAFHLGGLTGNASENSPKVILNIDGLKLEPKKLEYDATNHTFSYANWNTDTNGFLVDGKIYGGCYSSGYINGDVQINLRQNAISENVATAISEGTLTKSLVDHREDVFNTALSIFGAGYGEESEIWGNTEINLNSNDATDVNIVKVFGGGEMGVVGKLTRGVDGIRTGDAIEIYNATVNLLAGNVGKIYGGGFEGPLTGNTTLNLIGGTAYDAIAGACNARIGGHAEAYIGDVSKTTYPTITNNVYGGNDFGGKIESSYDFSGKLTTGETPYDEDVLTASTYVEYNKGKVNYIFGGAKASYDYSVDPYLTKVGTIDQTSKLPDNAPTINNAFVHFKPGQYANNAVARVYGGGQGYAGRSKDGPIFWQDQCQNQSYVLVNTTDSVTFLKTLVFGSGDASGLGMDIPVDDAHSNATGVTAAAVVDLISGKVDKVFGGSYQAGVTRRTIVNVPAGSTISIASSLFAGAYGSKNEFPCDVFEGNVNYSSEDARVRYIYGGNNDYRRTLYGKVNINSPVRYYSNEYGLTYGTVYGGGYGQNSWSQYTEVNLNDGAMVYEVYGGGYGGDVLNKASVQKMASQNSDWVFTLGNRYTADEDESNASASSSNNNDFGGLTNPLASGNLLATDYLSKQPRFNTKHNTNVHIYQGATVREYCYAGGYGQVLPDNSTTATVSGSTYIDLLGGTVGKDIYAAGTTGAVEDKYKTSTFIAAANAYVRGGTVRNVYGGGWRGSVGNSSYGNWKIENVDKVTTPSAIWNDESNDILGESNVVIGLLNATDFYAGVPAIKRSAYGGGEGGAIYGTANVYVYNGYVGYTYEDSEYKEKLDDETAEDGVGENDLDEAGNVFGGGYVANSYVDISNLYMFGGTVRNSLYGGGEIGPIGRGTVKGQGTGQALISKAGETHIYMYKGAVKRNVFGGGRGFDSWNSNGWMTDEEKRTIDLSSKGFIFGTTDVNIHGGEIGTDVGLADGYGNVFGGGNIGYVYSGLGTKSGTRGDGDKEGYYYDSDNNLTEDCRVNVKVYAEATATVTVNGHSYAAGDFINNEDLNTLTNGSSEWSSIDQTGITIFNAIFAGGNVSVGSSSVFAFANTIYGNATASVIDCFTRDLISVGGDGVGGIYGDGNLTFVDGYRELNITNYGTDYFALPKVLDASTQAQYDALTPRQKAFYVTRYTFDGNYDGGTGDATYLMYQKGDVVLNDVYDEFNDTQKSHWTASMSVINEGRYINTVQRCDFCGIRGSRLVLRGAMDRAQDKNEADYTNYTINRVGELSLNQNNQNGVNHGCYFGIYNVVKLLGGVTSDVKFKSVRTTDSDKTDDAADGTTTYYDWKNARITATNRNNGTSPNKIALASGVFLEIVKSVDGNGNKTYGPITGVVQLDLLNVATGEGGGYVYAENIHGVPTYDPDANLASVLADANKGFVITNKAYTYAPASLSDKMETSGNFIHPLKQIVDDCFPTANNFSPENSKSPAHYWYIRGEFFVYEQLISAYTGSANAYSTEITLPLTMSAQGNGKIRLLNVLPGLYTDPSKIGNFVYNVDPELATSDSLRISYATAEKAFGQNDPISYWDWYMASNVDKAKFVLKTYVCREEVTVNGTTYYPGQGITEAEYNSLANYMFEYEDGEVVSVQSLFNVTNGIGNYKDTGFLLTVDLTNPSKWNDYYMQANASEPVNHKLTTAAYNSLNDSEKTNYIKSATLHCIDGGTFGQYYFEQDAVTSKGVYDMQTQDVASGTDSIQATFTAAYVAKEDCEITVGGTTRTFLANSPISAETLSSISSEDQAHFENAYICVTTVLISEGNYHVLNELVGETEYNGLEAEIQSKFQPAYYCTSAGYWGGKHYVAGHNYQGLDYCQLHEKERVHFTFNYDALELLGNDYTPYDQTGIAGLTNAGANLNNNVIYYDYHSGTNVPNDTRIYSKPAYIDYTATVPATGYAYTGSIYVEGNTEIPLTPTTQLNQDQFVNLPNDRQHYAYFGLNDDDKLADGNYRTYIVTTTFDVAGTMYNAGTKVSESVYNDLGTTLQQNLQEVIITPTQYSSTTDGKFYYCIEAYEVGDKDQYIQGYTSSAINSITGTTYNTGATVPAGTILTYNEITTKTVNYQHGLEIAGDLPIEEASLYVPVTAKFEDLQEDRYVTVIYEYTYSESDEAGVNYETRVEKHIINIRLKFLSGAPVIGKIREPDIVLPLETISFAEPMVEEGAFPVLTGGWQIFSTEEQAKKHRNGRDYLNKTEPMYFYQDMYWVAYFAETRLGRTFSEPVPVHVANYQRMSDVINDAHHMYINHKDLKRDPKIYISDAMVEGQNYNELDALHEVFTLANSPEYGVMGGTDNNGRTITGAFGLDFILTSDVSPTRSWGPIGDSNYCFSGEFHGNGHTLSGMQASLFGDLCGNVFNTGVMGSFTSGGIADTGDGHVENCWVWTTGTPDTEKYAVFGNPTNLNYVVNCYYQQENDQETKFKADNTGAITPRSASDFVNGSVAYDLNSYYLEARYNLFTAEANVSNNPIINHCLFRKADGTLVIENVLDEEGHIVLDENDNVVTQPAPFDLKYTSNYAWHISGVNPAEYRSYVERFIEDGDFRFANGLKPRTDQRYSSDFGYYIPVYPDDYIFFGQKLSYGLYEGIPHDNHPMAAVKDYAKKDGDAIDNSRHLLLTTDTETENRIYRAPAYFQNGVYGQSAIFNATAAFAESYTIDELTYYPHKNMTAIDFTGSNGDTHGITTIYSNTNELQDKVAGIDSDFTDKTNGYHPLLDFERLDNIKVSGLTQNLLAYAPAPDTETNAKTNNVIIDYFDDPEYSESEDGYRTVAVQNADDVHGHAVQKISNSDYSDDKVLFTSITDHLLVDKQDFNAPMAYTFTEETETNPGKRMWYQRVPDTYVDLSTGWEGISIPFTAELVTTQTKGELTHFYEGSTNGHEYWLRTFDGIKARNATAQVDTAQFVYLGEGPNTKEYTNTFLWDYYYSKDPEAANMAGQDANTDEYQKEDDARTYYSEEREYSKYPYAASGTPYIIGFPGVTYYEFDLSGTFVPANTYNEIARLDKQTITFASITGATIAVSDNELTSGKVSEDQYGYTFTPNYLNKEIAAGAYTLKSDGSAYKKTEDVTAGVPFRPFFTSSTSNGAPKRGLPEEIVFSNTTGIGGISPSSDDLSDGLNIFATQGKIIVESHRKTIATVRILTPMGIIVKAFALQPGERVETHVSASGIYIVNTKKLHVGSY